MDPSSTIGSEIAGSLPEKINIDALSPENRNAYIQIQEIHEARKISITNIVNLTNILKEAQKKTAEKKALKVSLEKEISDVRSYLENETYQKDSISKQIEKMRQLSKDLGESTVCLDSTLDKCSCSEQSVVEAIRKQDVKITKNLTKMETLLTSKESKVKTAKKALLNQCEMYKSNIKRLEDEQFMFEEKLEKSRNQIAYLNKHFEELEKANEICLSKTKTVEEENEKLEGKLQQNQESVNKLLKEMEVQQNCFEENNLKMSKDLDDISYEIQVKGNAMNTLERAIKNQQNFNEDLKRKIKIQNDINAELQKQNEGLGNLQKSKQVESTEKETVLRETLNYKTAEVENLKSACDKDNKIVTETAQVIVVATNTYNELAQQIEQFEATVRELETKQHTLLEDLASLEQHVSSTRSNEETINKELDEQQLKNKNYELEIAETIAKKKAELNAALAEIEKIKNGYEEIAKSTYQEMNSIKTDFDKRAAEQIAAYEEKQKEMEAEIQKTENKHHEVAMFQLSHDKELKEICEECDFLKHKIKNYKNLNMFLASFAAMEAQIQAPPILQAPTSSKLPLPFSVPKQRPDFDQLSGSSAEGHNYTYQQVLEFKREKQRRRQMREQRLPAKKRNNSENYK